MNNRIGVLDSGLGGLSILKEMIKLMPNENFLFYEDSINNPYGIKSEDLLLKITSKIVDYLLENNCKIIVIACNTATTACMKKLREMYPSVIFVGTVPAIKMAYDNNCKSTLVLSTDYTMNSNRVHELISDFTRDDQQVINVSGENLAHLIENGDSVEITKLLNRILTPYKNKVDSIVLGCTHYSLIKEEIKKVLPNVKIFDSCLGVSREVRRQLINNNLISKKSGIGEVEIINTKNKLLIDRSFKILFGEE